jgi:hypothetical protein
MIQAHPVLYILGHAEDIPHGINLHLVEVLVHRCLEQRLQLVDAILNLRANHLRDRTGRVSQRRG